MDRRRFKLVPEMEGRVARWYARQRGTQSQMGLFRKQAVQVTEGLPSGARVLEVAPGPGYLAVAIAQLGRFQVTGLDISRTFIEIATEYARGTGVTVDLRQGDVANIPFDSASFDLVVCQAAFKNFPQPVRALDEMHRVLRTDGMAVIHDLSKDASNAEIDQEVKAMKLSRFNAFTTKFVLATLLRRRAYSPVEFKRVVAASAFRTCEIRKDGIGMDVRLRKSAMEKVA
jgi:ubiquinone/menaquinone biosynthesis C-methylase UbiE